MPTSSGTAINKFAERKPLFFWLPFVLACILTLVIALQVGKQADPLPPLEPPRDLRPTTTTTTTTTTMSTTWPSSRQSDLMVIWGKGYCLKDRWCPDNEGSARMISLDDDEVRPVRQPHPYQSEPGIHFPQGELGGTNVGGSDDNVSGRQYACSVIWHGEFYVIGAAKTGGGNYVKKMDDNCRMSHYGEYDRFNNADTLFSCFQHNDVIIAPFAHNSTRGLKGTNPWQLDEFAGANSNYDHLYAYTAASTDLLLVVGSTPYDNVYDKESRGKEYRNNKAETLALSGMDDTTGWTEVAQYPYADFIYGAPMIYYEGSDEFLIIGGQGPFVRDDFRIYNRIAAYSPISNAWTLKGNLLTKRRHAAVHEISNGLLIIGGFMSEGVADRADMYRAEKCVYDNNEFTCNYVYDFGRSVPYGETYIVDATNVPSCLP